MKVIMSRTFVYLGWTFPSQFFDWFWTNTYSHTTHSQLHFRKIFFAAGGQLCFILLYQLEDLECTISGPPYGSIVTLSWGSFPRNASIPLHLNGHWIVSRGPLARVDVTLTTCQVCSLSEADCDSFLLLWTLLNERDYLHNQLHNLWLPAWQSQNWFNLNSFKTFTFIDMLSLICA